MTRRQPPELDDIPDDHLEFVERLIFYEFDEAYRQYYQDDLPMLPEVRAYEQALQTISAIRRERDAERKQRMERTAEHVTATLES